MKTYDVVIAGGGAAGSVAAIAAGRKGVKTLLVEKENCAGGMATAGLLSLWGPFDDGQRRIIKGIPAEILQRLIRLGAAEDRAVGFIPVNPEYLKWVLDEALLEAKAQVLYHATLVDAKVKNNLIEEVVLGTKSGLERIKAKLFIDATGDADLAALSHVPCDWGDEKTGWIQPMTTVCLLGGIDANKYKWEGNWRYAEDLQAAQKSGAITFDTPWIAGAEYVPGMPGVVAVNMSHIFNLDPCSCEDLAQAEIVGRQQAQEIVRFFRKYVQGCAAAWLLSTAMLIGVRESRRIKGEYTLTVEDILEGRDFDDAIALNAYEIDIHLPQAMVTSRASQGRPKKAYGIPYRALLPQTIENLIVAGRCISATHVAHSSVRIMPACMATGQAAGVAAVLALKNRIRPGEINIALLRQELLKDGACL